MSARIGRVFSVTVTTALYRRYRPDSFADVIGQEHVTEPLMTALRKNRVNHAYLFSGPRGCGKTTSARILARCLNCAQGPTDTPCGTCPSCVELARGGSGSLDVIEIDAASHGGVDDARDLRERATYAPVRDRYKIFIIDEAHMVTSAGFNALLKIVEEPPEHIKFIFATTEPDKVIGTIRSRTHHYPFRLVPPEPLMAYLELLCNQENVPVAPGVLSLVIRAGGGSVRDSLSVLDQLMAGAGPNGLDYELAVALLGYTHASLLDDVVEAVAASDAATVFRAVDRVIQTGHDPRRFVEDLLERFRDLIIVQAMPESAQTILRGMPADQIARLKNQAHNLGAAELSRAADVTNTALTEMTGATSPRLHLELLCARILLPSSEQNERGMAARIDRVERRLNYAGNDVGAPAAPGAPRTAADVSPAPQAGALPAPAAAVPESPAAPAVSGGGQAVPAAPPAAAAPVAPAASQPPAVSGASSTPAGASAASPSAPAPDSASAAPAAPATHAASRAEDVSSPAGAPRGPLTAPRVSTNDWPVEDPAANRSSSTPPAGRGGDVPRPATAEPASAAPGQAQGGPSGAAPGPVQGTRQEPADRPAPVSTPQPSPAQQDRPAPAAAAAAGSMGDVEVLRRAWPDVLQTLSKIKRSTWALVEPNAQVAAFDGHLLTLAFTTPGLAGAFGRADHSDNLRQAIHKTVGIDCQITASAGGGAQASSDPNPKVPATRVAQATSADVAWGLAPAPSSSPDDSVQQPGTPGRASGGNQQGGLPGRDGADSAALHTPGRDAQQRTEGAAARDNAGRTGAATPEPAADQAAVSANPASPFAEGGAGSAPGQAPGRVPTPAHASPAPVAAAPAGDYSYSDDDWGPARDEDAPPLDEEPPMDWDPSAHSRPPATAGTTSNSTGSGSAVSGSAASGSAVSGSAVSGSAGTGGVPSRSGSSVVGSAPAGSASGTTAQGNGRPGADPASASGSPHDPWTRAVEQAPGVWVVGEESNVGRSASADGPEEAANPPAPTPHYEPAAAQVPPSIPVTQAGSSPEPDWGLAPAPSPGSGQPGADPYGQAPSSPEHMRAPEYAMASASPAAATPAHATHAPAAPSPAAPSPAVSSPAPSAPAASVTAAAAPAAPAKAAPAKSPQASSAAAAEARQSLYQRLSNSPEAEAGRAKAPARAVAAAATYVQDIPSADDETIEESGVFGRAAVERILGGKLIEERSPDGSPIAPRY
ncbi:DNA polymerase III subunit gamma and tau [Pseudarthrobacter oxydans]|uniref:DNA polymerase III subunit gamma and tau n=1 Tax=Pseudarthrobacter oxydans TaxID=1671 RepID=UPI001572AD3F|nr:DNA polymerase III subunit gamma and tau [Pseudarthrobacter oxydans]NSX38383.1 DNA polymerase III subunit gamma and tau [Pseudarthrobacter oxydans]